MMLHDFPADLTPLIQMIDTWFEARKLALMFEAKVGNGKLLVTSIDFKKNLNERPAARQLYSSVLKYVSSDQFNPMVAVDLKLIKGLYK